MPLIQRVMIVDDDPHIGQMLQGKIASQGYEVHHHDRAKGTLEAALGFKAQLLLLDVMLGDGIGYEVARSIRKNPALYQIPILFQSVVGEERDIAHAFVEGGDGYLTKPYTVQELQSSLERMEQLAQDTEQVREPTGHRSLAYMRRVVDHCLFRNEHFALFYISVGGKEGTKSGEKNTYLESRLPSIGKAIRNTIAHAGFYETVTAHMGSTHFMVKTRIDDRERFYRLVHEAIDGVVRTKDEVKSGSKDGKAKVALHDSGVGVTFKMAHTGQRNYSHAHELFDKISRHPDM